MTFLNSAGSEISAAILRGIIPIGKSHESVVFFKVQNHVAHLSTISFINWAPCSCIILGRSSSPSNNPSSLIVAVSMNPFSRRNT